LNPIRESWTSADGQHRILDKIICGDNVATMQTFPDGCIDLTVTSPPYDNLRTYGGHTWDFEAVAQQLWRVTKPGGVVVWVVADATVNGSETGTSFRQALRFMEIGFRLHDTMIWEKPNPRPTQNNRYESAFEYCFVFSSGSPTTVNLIRERTVTNGWAVKHRAVGGRVEVASEGGRYRHKETKIKRNVWSIQIGDSGLGQPAAFPESLARDHILSWSNEGDVVLDPFAGSGTTCKMARAMGRRYVGIEINPDYCEICRKRLAQNVLEFGIERMEREAARHPLLEPKPLTQRSLI
jgi:site-specific DNA-methyltransferase (adenine-specific)